ncbi:MAG: hypothetical protein IJN49_00650 [Clostridia bacterium]|nr:hypothetical protein [Clostridia bacterium]
MKWYYKTLIAVVIILFSPLIIVGLIIWGVSELIHLPGNIKEYKNSQYFKDFQLPYKAHKLDSPEYRFYNSIKERNIEVDYIRQEDTEYFIYENTLFLFPDFYQILFDDEDSKWVADYDSDFQPLEEACQKIIDELHNIQKDYPIKILVERKMCTETNLNKFEIPDYIFLTWSYETAFENEDSPLKLIVPETTEQLYDMMKETPDIKGKFHLANNKIIWNINEKEQIEIGVDPRDCYIGLNKKVVGKFYVGKTHYHPTIFNVYQEVCKIDKQGGYYEG